MNEKNQTTILIVDDNKANLFALEQIITKPNRNIIAATDGNKALKILLKENIDLVILDVQMPEMDGFEVAQIIKSGKRTKDIPIIFATAAKKEHYFMLKGLEQGAIDYLYKPLDPDITEAKVAVLLELQLNKRELIEKNDILEKDALLINNSTDLIGIINPYTLKFEKINRSAAKLLGKKDDTLIGTSLLSYLSTADKKMVKELSNSSNEHISFNTRVFAKNGDFKWLDWNIVNRKDKWFANARDVTDIKRAEELLKQQANELRRINRGLESFSYSVSHDLRAPLRVIGGFAEMLVKNYGKEQTTLDQKALKMLDVISSNVNNMQSLINDLLSFSRAGNADLKFDEVDMNELVKEMIELCVPQERNNGVIIEVDNLPPALCDRNLMKHVYQNLISNAIKYSSKVEQPTVKIGVSIQDEEIIYFVKDNGAGFDMEYSDKLFEVFERLHSAHEYEGTGIGLALVKKIIGRHGGRIWAESKPDKGAVFYFNLPGNTK